MVTGVTAVSALSGSFHDSQTLVDRIVEPELVSFGQLEDGERVDGLADGRGLETRPRRHRPVGLRVAVAVGCDDRAVLDDGEADARHFVLREQGTDRRALRGPSAGGSVLTTAVGCAPANDEADDRREPAKHLPAM